MAWAGFIFRRLHRELPVRRTDFFGLQLTCWLGEQTCSGLE